MFAPPKTFPGIYFESSPASLNTALPRMDIALFVGFASSGPLHTPVAVEDLQTFREIFGPDLELAWDSARAQVEKSYLGVSVDNFFRNGGRRCWIVRVADENIAQTAKVNIPGLIRVNDSDFEAAIASARSPGSWAASVFVRSILNSRAQQFTQSVDDTLSLSIDTSGWFAHIVASEADVERGNLIQLQLHSSASNYYLIVDEIISTEFGLRISGTQGYFIDRDIPGSASSSPSVIDPAFALNDAQAIGDYMIYRISDFDTLGLSVNWAYDPDDAYPPTIQRLTFTLRTLEASGKTRSIDNLAFSSNSERFWAWLPDDESVFANRDGQQRSQLTEARQRLISQASTPRFPISGDENSRTWTYLPVTMADVANTNARASFSDTGDQLQRDGLVNFGSSHFVDSRLSNLRLNSLLHEANKLAYLSNPPQKLRGIHCALGLEEASLIAVPDAIHCRWENTPPEYDLPLAAPVLDSPQKNTLLDGSYHFAWTEIQGSSRYTFEWSQNPDFIGSERVIVGSSDLPSGGADNNFLSPPDNEYFLNLEHVCPREYFFRVRAENENEISTWSNSRALLVPETDFLTCAYVQSQQLELDLSISVNSPNLLSSPPAEGHELQWQSNSENSTTQQAVINLIDGYELQRSKDKNFFEPDSIFSGDPSLLGDANTPSYFINLESDTPYYYRVRAMARETLGPWSNTLIIWPSSLSQVSLQQKRDFANADVLSIHRHLLRIAQARGDLFAVLSLPRHYEAEDALNHYALLKPSSSIQSNISSDGDEFNTYTPPLNIAEQKASSYAGLYYPWVSTHVENSSGVGLSIITSPPEGLVLGKIAEKTLEQGAWFAPANSPFKDLLALDKNITQAQWQALMKSKVNVIRAQASGYLLMSADTLSTETDWREINVRRLFSLLKRVVLKEGNRLLFESNNEFLRNSIKRQFENILERLYDRGAFAGSTASQAFRVITDESVNTRQNMENGQLIVELHVAPSLPLKFIRIRLLQEGLGQSVVEELSR